MRKIAKTEIWLVQHCAAILTIAELLLTVESKSCRSGGVRVAVATLLRSRSRKNLRRVDESVEFDFRQLWMIHAIDAEPGGPFCCNSFIQLCSHARQCTIYISIHTEHWQHRLMTRKRLLHYVLYVDQLQLSIWIYALWQQFYSTLVFYTDITTIRPTRISMWITNKVLQLEIGVCLSFIVLMSGG